MRRNGLLNDRAIPEPAVELLCDDLLERRLHRAVFSDNDLERRLIDVHGHVIDRSVG